jgi:hypothetical protein
MKFAPWPFLLAGLLLAGAYWLSGASGGRGFFSPAAVEAADPPPGKPAEKPKPLPALKVDKNAPLLLDTPAETKPPGTGKGPKADNHACFVCHTNYQDEWMAVEHANANVGCVKCHGESIAHRNDENNITPPDIMYPAEGIDTACVKCHETHNAPAKKVLARWKERCAAKTDFNLLICTDCHGDHRLKLRSVRWDKKTGKLLTGAAPQSKAVSAGAGRPGPQTARPGS